MRALLIEFTHLGDPPKGTQQGKRAVARKGKPPIVIPGKNTESAFEDWAVILRPHKPAFPLSCPLELELTLVWAYPKPKNKAEAAKQAGDTPKTTKPDRVNVEKIMEDCMKRVGYFTDDNLVWASHTKKLNGPVPRVEVKVWGTV